MITRDELAMKVGQKLALAREDMDLSRKEFAERLGLSEKGYGHIEAGRNLLTLDRLVQLPRITGKPLTYFFPNEITSPQERDNLMLDPRFQELAVAWQTLAALDDPEPLDLIHDLAVELARRRSPKED